MKAKELRQMTVADLVAKEKTLSEEAFRLGLKLASGQLDKPSTYRQCRINLAQVKTIIREKRTADKKREVKP